MPAETANTAILARSGDRPDVRAATSELRAANIARPDADRWRLTTTRVSRPNTSNSRIASDFGSLKWKGPNTGGLTKYPSEPLRMELMKNRISSAMKAIDNVARASSSAPRRRTGRAMITPASIVTAAPNSVAIMKFRCPWATRSGMSDP